MLDTLKYSETLIAAGMDVKIARASAYALADTLSETAVTKTDLTTEINSVRTELRELKTMNKALILAVSIVGGLLTIAQFVH